MSRLLPTRNPAWGFYHEASRAAGDDVEAGTLFLVAEGLVVDELAHHRVPGTKREAVARDLLDSRLGRHLADAIGLRRGLDRASMRERLPRWFRKEVRRFLASYAGADFEPVPSRSM